MKEKRFETPLDPQLKKTLQSLKEMPDRDAATAHHRKEQFIKSVIEIRQQKGISSGNQRPQKKKIKFAFLRNTMSAKLVTIVLA
ncbi:MAG: hypothetical protein K8R40_08265, partial [Anaerolineaceae bacterium]|nr:hypothetical protein [Anaerolineaceae bacterium]